MLVVDDSPLYSADFFAAADPWSYLADLREHHPVSIHRRADGYEFYALTRYADVYSAYVDNAALSSSYGTMIDGSYLPQRDSASGRMLIVADEPAHAAIKKPIKASGFSQVMLRKIGRTVRGNIRAAATACAFHIHENGGSGLQGPFKIIISEFGLPRSGE